MQAIRGLHLAHSNSRTSTPAPPPAPGVRKEHHIDITRAVSKFQSLAKLGRQTPPSSPAPPSFTPLPLVHDGSYLTALATKISEAASRALNPIVAPNGAGGDVFKGRKPLPAGRGSYLGSLIASELESAKGDINLERAIIRLLPRSISVVSATLSSQLLPLLSVPGYAQVLSASQLPPATAHALGIATFSAELLETLFDPYDLSSKSNDLATIKIALETLIQRVITPIFASIQSDLTVALEQLLEPSLYAKGRLVPHPAIVQLQNLLPGVKRLLKRCITPWSSPVKGPVASLLIAIVWGGMINLAYRPSRVDGNQTPPSPSTPGSKASSLPSTPGSRFASLPGTPARFPLRVLGATIGSGSPSLGLISLPPPTNNRRTPSPPPQRSSPVMASEASIMDSRVFLEMVDDLVFECGPPPGSLAREAVEEAVDKLRIFVNWLSTGDATQLDDVPLLVILGVLTGTGYGKVAEYLGVDEDRLKKRILTGFVRAEEHAEKAGCAVLNGFEAEHGKESKRARVIRSIVQMRFDSH